MVRTVELPGVAVEVDEGQSLFLTLSAVSDVSFGHGSVRTPGAVVLEDLAAEVPLVEACALPSENQFRTSTLP